MTLLHQICAILETNVTCDLKNFDESLIRKHLKVILTSFLKIVCAYMFMCLSMSVPKCACPQRHSEPLELE